MRRSLFCFQAIPCLLFLGRDFRYDSMMFCIPETVYLASFILIPQNPSSCRTVQLSHSDSSTPTIPSCSSVRLTSSCELMAASSCRVGERERKANPIFRRGLYLQGFSGRIITWAPFSRSLRALTADKNPPTPLVEDTIGSAMGGAVVADGVVD